MKTFKTKGLNYFATNVDNIFEAMALFIVNRVGVTIKDIEEFKGDLPEDATVFKG